MPQPNPVIRAANLDDLLDLTRLYIAYRVFYGEPPAEAAAEQFIRERISSNAGRYFLAWDEHGERTSPVGFMHLMPSTNTLAMRPIWLLEDLYIEPAARRQGIASCLLREAEAFARRTGAERITLSTAHNNEIAQSIYRRAGYEREEHFWYFHRVLT